MLQIFGYISLIVGIILLIIEGIIPGFGTVGVLGFLLNLLGVYITTKNAMYTAIIMVIVFVIFIIYNYIIIIIYKKSSDNDIKTNGIDVHKQSLKLIGKEYMCIKTINPCGEIRIGKNIVSVCNDSQKIQQGNKVVVTKVLNGKIYVERVEKC